MSDAVKSYLDAAGVEYKILVADGPTMTAQDARRLQVPLSMIIKKLSTIVGASKLRIASAEDTEGLTGFEVGAMPPLGHTNRIATVIDCRFVDFQKVYRGGRTSNALLEIDPREIARLTDAKVADISE